MLTPRFKTIAAVLCLCLGAAAVTPYATLSDKANRFFQHREWASASAMYTLMLEQRRDSAGVYGDAIVAAGMMKQPDRQNELFTDALNAHLPIDSVLQATEEASLRAEQSSLYEQFLYAVKEREPWLNRIIDARLMSYYSFRDNGPGLVTMSEIMLSGLPDDERFLYSLARGKLLCDDISGAIDVYRRIITLYPSSRDALLYLGNYYAPTEPQAALSYLEKALEQRYTPYVAAKIARLKSKR